MKTYITVAVERGMAGQLSTDVSEFMEKGYEPFGSLVAVGDRLIQPMILTNWKWELGIEGETTNADSRATATGSEAPVGRETGFGEPGMEGSSEPEPQLREDRGERE